MGHDRFGAARGLRSTRCCSQAQNQQFREKSHSILLENTVLLTLSKGNTAILPV
jgi:hypothetical protein